MNRMFNLTLKNLWSVLITVLLVSSCGLILSACSENVAGGTVTDPNTLAIGSSSSAQPSDVVVPGIIDEPDWVDPSIRIPYDSALVQGTGSKDSLVFPDTIPFSGPSVVPLDSCLNEIGESICPSPLFEEADEIFYESSYCIVKVMNGPVYYGAVMQFQKGSEFIQMEDYLVDELSDEPVSYNRNIATHLAEPHWGVCNSLLSEFESFVNPRSDSLLNLGVAGVYAHWDRNGCENGTIRRMWYEYSEPEGIRNQLAKRAEQYKENCARWESEF